MKDKTLNKDLIDHLYHFIRVQLQDPSELFLKISTVKYCQGLTDNITVKSSSDEIKFKLEEIYRSWWYSTPAQAYRITYSLGATDTYPAVIIQPHYPEVFSLVTRSPRSGRATSANDLYIIHNTVEVFKSHHAIMLEKTEACLGFPAKIYFAENGDTKICGVKPEFMTDNAYWISLNDLYKKGYIDDIQLLSSIKPNMIAQKEISPPIEEIILDSESTKIEGNPISPGSAYGKLIFTTTENLKDKENYILCIPYWKPDDMEHIDKFIGAIGNQGGGTSHLGVISRHFNKPAVIIDEMKIDPFNRQVWIGSQDFQEGTFVFVDGNLGKVVLSQAPFTFLTSPRYRSNVQYENLEQVYAVLMKSTLDTNTFRNLSIELQAHLSTLTQQFRRIGFDKIT